jgi:hypothetical protein
MENSFNLPKYKICRYFSNPQTGYYQKLPELISFQKLPFELKIEESQKKWLKSQGANQIIRGRIKNGKPTFFTGLVEFPRIGWFYGNDFEFVKEKKINSLVLFKFSGCWSELTVYYFNHFYKYDQQLREKFIHQFINRI